MKRIFLISLLFLISFGAIAQYDIQLFNEKGVNLSIKVKDTLTQKDTTFTIPIDTFNISGEYSGFYNILKNYTDGEIVNGYVYQNSKESLVFNRLVINCDSKNPIVNINQVNTSFPVKLSTGDLTKFNILFNKIGIKINER